MTMRSETTPQPYKVWRIPFAFDDQPDVFKFRPVIFGGIGQGGVQLMLLSVKVTTHPPKQGIEGEKSHCSTGKQTLHGSLQLNVFGAFVSVGRPTPIWETIN